ncbi:hypothetical protein GJ633_12880 [Halorubrum sp. CBA1125]|uniref:hypothetical protein n=1 Tax=Halorubrum sp. CBA1125 TaxID=2668072 RepID=UPI0012E70295|nr:hypothetical protein [Halorubrum sp. CBA1125]MUW15432.1 hypothetical protein [Halorubrum sp. CBA1125]
MRFPRPSPSKYAGDTIAVVLTLAVLQYTGLFFDGPGTLDLSYLAAIAVLFPVFTYLISVVTANVEWVPSWDR